MRDIGQKRTSALDRKKNDGNWWIKGMFFVAAVLMTLAHFGLQRSFALERAAVGEQQQVEDISEEDRKGLASIILGEN
mgnify:FL=1